MSTTTKYEFVGIALSATPQQLFTRAVFDWSLKAGPSNTGVAYLTKQTGVYPHQYPLSAKDSVSHGDFVKSGFDNYEDITQLYVVGTPGDYVHLLVYYEDR